ncbi:MAG TPA: GYD domain-containing protein, partial [Actinomycetota bacterium]|nr:GYD domain-containing protein [Actinomycetota bacterium]
IAKYGGSAKEILWTLGPYDIVAIVEAPDDETMTAAALELGALGTVRTTTLRAFGRDEFEAIVKKTG